MDVVDETIPRRVLGRDVTGYNVAPGTSLAAALHDAAGADPAVLLVFLRHYG